MTTTTAVAWHTGPLTGFDLETTGVDVWGDRIVTAAIVTITPGQPPATTTWLANPGIPIPDEAAAVHGITTERAQTEGRDPAEVIHEIAEHLDAAIQAGTPIVGMNLAFDLTLLDSECRRHGHEPLAAPAPIIDIRVLDKQVDRYRKGGRTLTDLCRHYGVALDQAHNAAADVLGALRVAYKIAQRYPALQIDPLDLHQRQADWHAEQVASFAAYRARIGQPIDDADTAWPVRQREI